MLFIPDAISCDVLDLSLSFHAVRAVVLLEVKLNYAMRKWSNFDKDFWELTAVIIF